MTLPNAELLDLGALAPSARRVLVAKDILDLLAAQAIHPEKGAYVDLDARAILKPEEQLREAFEEELQQYGCRVCAIGATFVAAVRRFNDVTAERFVADGLTGLAARPHIIDYMLRIFDRLQLDMIEAAFEGVEFAPMRLSEDAYSRCYLFFNQYEHDIDCFRAIMQNIIANNGEFIP
jgi:hypothetical protein